jgi:hypothetical protein
MVALAYNRPETLDKEAIMNIISDVRNSFLDGCMQALRGYRALALTIHRFLSAGDAR